MMLFVWDNAKRRTNLRKHGVDFADANVKRTSTSRKSLTRPSKGRRTPDSDVIRDADAPPWTPEMFARAVARQGLKPVPRKALLSLRIDADVIDWFRKQGPGYQSRMNALLRAYMEAHT